MNRHGSSPVRWWVFDDFCVPPTDPIPPASWPGWEVQYANAAENRKRTTRNLSSVFTQPWFARLFSPEYAQEWSEILGYPVEQDTTLHGGGLHVTGAGGSLATHLDYARHPKIPAKKRALNLILFIHPEWKESYGGHLYLADPMGNAITSFSPKPGRLVAFETSDLSYHGVKPTSSDAPDRVSIAVYMLTEATPADTRQRALFLPVRDTMG